MASQNRKYYLDWLRMVGVYLVIPFHSLLIFNLNPWSIVYVKDQIHVPLFVLIADVIHRFHMPLLFVIAGMALNYSLRNRALGNHAGFRWLRDRVNKLLIPLLFGSVVLNPVMTYIHGLSLGRSISFLAHLQGYFTKNPGDLAGLEGGFTPAHLWFILYLFLFTLAGVPLVSKYGRKQGSRGSSASGGRSFGNHLKKLLGKPLGLLVLILPVALISLIDVLGDKNPFVYFTLFLIGYLLAKPGYEEALKRDARAYLVLGILAVYLVFTLPYPPPEVSLTWVGFALLEKASRLVPVFGLLGIGARYLNHPYQGLTRLSEAGFPIYVVHMLVNTIVGYLVIQLPLAVSLKYILIVVLTFGLSFGIYDLAGRIPGLSLLLGIGTARQGKPSRKSPVS